MRYQQGPVSVGINLARAGSDVTALSVIHDGSLVNTITLNVSGFPRAPHTDDMRQMIDDLEAHGGAPRLRILDSIQSIMSNTTREIVGAHDARKKSWPRGEDRNWHGQERAQW